MHIQSKKTISIDDKGYSHYVMLLAISSLIAAIITSQIPITTNYPERPAQVLGDESSDSGKGSPTPIPSVKTEEDKIITSPIPAETPEKLPTSSEPEQQQQEVKPEMKKAEFKIVNTKGKPQIEIKDDKQQPLSTQEKNDVEKDLTKDEIHISTGEGKLIIFKKNFGAATNFPLSVDTQTNQLVVTTPSGVKTVTVLPDQAIKNLLSLKEIDQVLNTSDNEQSNESSSSAKVNQVVQLIEKNNQLVYEVKGTKSHKLLGFIPINTEVTVNVSADSGNIVSKEQSLLSRIIEMLSF